jgi:hypothetical protein
MPQRPMAHPPAPPPPPARAARAGGVTALGSGLEVAVLRGGLRAVSRGAVAAALVEAPVAVIEEVLAVRQGRKSPEQAALAAGAKVGVAAVGGGLGAGLAYGLGVLGVGSLLTPVGPVLLLAGSASVVLSTGMRLRSAFAAGPGRAALAPEPPPDFIEMEPGRAGEGSEIWFVPPTPGSAGDPGT